MGSYKWAYKALIWVVSIVTLLITLLITTHEPPSRGSQTVAQRTLITGFTWLGILVGLLE